LARYVFDTLGYRRYEWKCDSLNAPSRRAALRYGFVYAMLDSGWPTRKRNFERWLSPENFDTQGARFRFSAGPVSRRISYGIAVPGYSI
jgi:hypothetical protein